MSTADELTSELAQWIKPIAQVRQERLEAIRKLPKRLQSCAFGLLDLNAKGGRVPLKSYENYTDFRKKNAATLDALSADDRERIFACFFPAMAGAVEGAWELLKAAPYQNRWNGSPFRLPSQPAVHLESRYSWLTEHLDLLKYFNRATLTTEWLAPRSVAIQKHISTASEVDLIEADEDEESTEIEESTDNPAFDDLLQVIRRQTRWRQVDLRPLLAAGVDRDDQTLEILRQIVHREHEFATINSQVISALLKSSREEAWGIVVDLLLAAQRQEGLRQEILEAAPHAHPEAFGRLLSVILAEDLIRFSAVARSVDVWLGWGWDSASMGILRDGVAMLVEFLNDPAAIDAALLGKDATRASVALWTIAFRDAEASIAPAVALLSHKQPEMRFVAARHLQKTQLVAAGRAAIEAIDDEDLQVALAAMDAAANSEGESANVGLWRHDTKKPKGKAHPEEWRIARFEALERLFERVPKKAQKLKALVWPWTERKVDRATIASALAHAHSGLPLKRIFPYLDSLPPYYQRQQILLLSQEKDWDSSARQAVIQAAGHTSEHARQAAFTALASRALEADDYGVLEGYLRRKPADLRQGVINLLLEQPDAAALNSADRLLGARNMPQRLAGLEMLRQLADADRCLEAVRERAAEYARQQKTLSREEEVQIASIQQADAPTWSAKDGFGLLNPDGRTPVRPPKKRKVKPFSKAAAACLVTLDQLVEKHKETPVTITDSYTGKSTEVPLGGMRPYQFPHYFRHAPYRDDPQHSAIYRDQFPLAEIWLKWNADRPRGQRDGDGCELIRAQNALNVNLPQWEWSTIREWCVKSKNVPLFEELVGPFTPSVKLNYPGHVKQILKWLLFREAPPEGPELLLQLAEHAMASVPPKMNDNLKPTQESLAATARRMTEDFGRSDWRTLQLYRCWLDRCRILAHEAPDAFTPDQKERLWQLTHFMDEPFPGAVRHRPSLQIVFEAYERGMASEDDLVDQLVGPTNQLDESSNRFGDVSSLTNPIPDKEIRSLLEKSPFLRETLDRIRERALKIELARGEGPTVATGLALAIRSLYGLDTLTRLLRAIDSAKFKPAARWSYSGGTGRSSVFTNLLKATYPLPEDTPEAFTQRMHSMIKEGQCDEQRLIELAFLAPQWTRHVEHALGWAGFAEGLYWYLAHMDEYSVGTATTAAVMAEESQDESAGAVGDGETDGESQPNQRRMSAWERLVLERTPLSALERSQGAVDVAWCRRTWKLLGEERWEQLANAARYAANAAQAKKAKFLSDTLLGKTDRAVLVKGIQDRKLKENVRQLGLLPLAGSSAQQRKDVLERYEVLQEYKRYAKKLSGLTKPEAMRAAEIGFDNLARLAGYPDPLRLEWAMEAESVKDLAQGPVSQQEGDLKVTLTLDEQARPELVIQRGEKTIKTVPAAVKKKSPAIAELLERGKDLKRKSSRIKQSLEAAMCRGDLFGAHEIVELSGHALLAPQLNRLLLVGDGIIGYPDKGGKVLRDFDGKLEPIKKKEQLRIAHPHDLLLAGNWSEWQRDCFASERVQPFKQIFRELYVLTKQEAKDGTHSQRFAGQQIQPRQAIALWNSRGWHTAEEIVKVFHDLGIVVQVEFEYGVGTPLEVEGWTIRDISFIKREDGLNLPLKEVPPILFSEVMRDIDLVVSVAHRGEVDPEATASTVEMRSALLKETCTLLDLANVRQKTNHAYIKGHFGEYSVHLGSGVVHRLPGGSVCIVPVHAQHRGRLFLPFADDDPRTAEVISKVLLLARDKEILDPSILEQIR